ncbi:substrate-binding domain-containing protein [Sorangium sp. So ce134]
MQGTSKVIGVAANFIDNSFNSTAFAGMHRAARERGYQILFIYGTPRDVARRGVAVRRVAGWVAMYTSDGLEELLSDTTPAVLFCASPVGARFPVVRAENRGSIHRLVDHLVGLGRRRIAYIGKSSPGSDDFIERATSFEEAMSARGLEADLNLVSWFKDCLGTYTEQRLGAYLDRAGKFCDAIVAGNDDMAIGAIKAIRARGYRVPDDIAVVGFDDIAAAQHCDPPLTTMRQNPELLGSMSVHRLADLIEGRAPEQRVTRISAELVVRRSCGAGAAREAAPRAPGPAESTGDWQRDLCLQLNVLLTGEMPSPVDGAPLVWPEALVIARGLGAALTGAELPGAETLERAFDAAIAYSDRIEVLLAVVKQVEQTAARRLGGAPGPDAALRVETFIDRVRLAQQRALAAWTRCSVENLQRLVRANMDTSMLLASRQLWFDDRLGWLRHTSMRVACIALWAADPGPGGPELIIDSLRAREAGLETLVGRSSPAGVFPPHELIEAASPDEPSGYLLLIPIASARRDWGVLVVGGVYAESFADNLQPLSTWTTLLSAAFDRYDLEAALHAERDMLAAAYERESALASTVRELGCPVIPLLQGVLLVPLLGAIDAARAQQILEAVLSGVARESARWVLLDVTGVPLVDPESAASLVRTAQAARLLGARVSLVGVRARMAQRMVDLGIELRDISMFQSLAAAISELTRTAA